MNPTRLVVRFPLTRPASDLETATAVFHRFIQYGSVEGLVLDVADYRHVPSGPGMMLVGHEIDYAISETWFTVFRKRRLGDPIGVQLRDALRMGLGAIAAIEHDGALDAEVDTTSFTVAVADRRLGSPDELLALLESAVQEAVAEVHGPGANVVPVVSADPREATSVRVTVTADAARGALEALGGSQVPGQSPWDIPVEELARLRDEGADFTLVDVREESEFQTVNLGGRLLPLATLDQHFDELDKDGHVVVHCRAGWRGAKAVTQLREAGFTNAWNVNGALMAWIDRIDPSLARY